MMVTGVTVRIGAERRAETAAPSRNETKSSQAAGEVGEDLVTPGRHVRTWAARADQFLTLPRCSPVGLLLQRWMLCGRRRAGFQWSQESASKQT